MSALLSVLIAIAVTPWKAVARPARAVFGGAALLAASLVPFGGPVHAAYDVNLVLDSGQTVTADSTTTPIQVEGGAFVVLRSIFGAMSGASTTCDVYLQYSFDNVTYYMVTKLQQLGPTDDNKKPAAVGFIPPHTTAGSRVYVRLRYEVAGGAPSYAVTKVYMEPLMSLAVSPVDFAQAEGLCARIAAI